MRRRLVRARVRALMVAVALLVGMGAVGCTPDNTEFQVLDNVPYHPVAAADLVVGSWSDLVGLAGAAPAVAERVVDVHRSTPAPPAGAPVMVYVPGGAWQFHNQNTLPEALERYIARGWVIVTVGYTKAAAAADTQWPVQGREIDWVVRWVRANAAALGVAADEVVLAGHSAGAHLAAQVATREFATNPALPAPAGGDPALGTLSSRPDALVLLAGAYDLSPAGVPMNPGTAQIPAYWPQQALLGCDPGLPACAARVAEASVVHATDDADLGNLPPTFLAHGDADTDTPVWPNAIRLGSQLCDDTDVPLSQEQVAGEDHDLATLDYAKLDHFLHRHGLLPPVPVATTTWTCN